MSKLIANKSTNDHPPEGWPSWLWFLVLQFVSAQALIALGEKEGVMRGISDLAHKLDECRKEKQEWRQRALSAEKVISNELLDALKIALVRHDTEHGTSIGWRF